MRLGWATLLVTASAVAAPREEQPTLVLVPRPTIDLAAVTPAADRTRPWPLSELPSLQPHHDFAMASDLCTDAWAQSRQKQTDLLAYRDAWCKIKRGEDGVGDLAKLAQAATGSFQRAARLDVLNLVTRRGAAQTIAQLAELRLETVDNLDSVAALFDALDQHEDAIVVARRSWRLDRTPSPLARCERTLAWSPLDEDALGHARDLASKSKGSCAKRAAALACAIEAARGGRTSAQVLAVRECFNEFPDDVDADRRASLLVAHEHWPEATVAGWLALSSDAANALGLPGAEDVAITALDNAVRSSRCEPAQLREISSAAARIADKHGHRDTYDPRLTDLRGMSVGRCNALTGSF